MYDPELVFEIFNFEWKHVFTFLSQTDMAKIIIVNADQHKKFITQKRIKLMM